MRTALVVLPTYNEKENIKKILLYIFNQQNKLKIWSLEVLVVDSQSPDKTAEIVWQLKTKYGSKLHLIETTKKGLGKAYSEGFLYAIEKIKPYVMFEMDADLSHNPNDIPKFLKEIEKGADFVIGSRYIKGGSIPKDWGLHRKIFSFMGNFIVKYGFMIPSINDWTSGFRAIKTWLVKESINHIKKYSGYVFQIAFLDLAHKKGANIVEVPINFVDRRYGQSKISFGEYIFQILFYIFLNSSFIKYLIVGSIGFLIDFSLFFLFYSIIRLPIWLSTSLSAETAIISNFILNNFWSFSFKKIKGTSFNYLFKFIKFNFISLGSILIQAIGIELLVLIFSQNFVYLYKALIIVFLVIPYSYFMYNKLIWNKKPR